LFLSVLFFGGGGGVVPFRLVVCGFLWFVVFVVFFRGYSFVFVGGSGGGGVVWRFGERSSSCSLSVGWWGVFFFFFFFFFLGGFGVGLLWFGFFFSFWWFFFFLFGGVGVVGVVGFFYVIFGWFVLWCLFSFFFSSSFGRFWVWVLVGRVGVGGRVWVLGPWFFSGLLVCFSFCFWVAFLCSGISVVFLLSVGGCPFSSGVSGGWFVGWFRGGVGFGSFLFSRGVGGGVLCRSGVGLVFVGGLCLFFGWVTLLFVFRFFYFLRGRGGFLWVFFAGGGVLSFFLVWFSLCLVFYFLGFVGWFRFFSLLWFLFFFFSLRWVFPVGCGGSSVFVSSFHLLCVLRVFWVFLSWGGFVGVSWGVCLMVLVGFLGVLICGSFFSSFLGWGLLVRLFFFFFVGPFFFFFW